MKTDTVELREIQSLTDTLKVLWTINNDNFECGVGFRSLRGAPQFRYPHRLFVAGVIEAAADTIHGNVCEGKERAFLPLCGDGWRPRTRWAAIRFDGAGANVDRIARRTFKCVRAYARGACTVLEHLGDGSWQLWFIKRGFSAHKTWGKLLDHILCEAVVDRADCQVFPNGGVPPGLLAPGSWDPRSGEVSRIVHADLTLITGREAYTNHE